jgi:hypothetical protein
MEDKWLEEDRVAKIREHVSYNPDTGELTCIKAYHIRQVGDVLGYVNADGYVVTNLFGYSFRVHQWAFLFMEGIIPPTIDHRDGNKQNNRWTNLRRATRSQNAANGTAYSGKKYRGVSYHKREGKWRAVIIVDYKYITLGEFTSEHDAARAYNEAARQHFGDYARLNDVTRNDGDYNG